jgi:hypothetical protein
VSRCWPPGWPEIPYSFTLHGPADLAEPARWGLGEKIAASRFVACISHYARSQAMLMSDPAHWDRLKIVHCGVDPALYDTRDRVAAATATTRGCIWSSSAGSRR